MYVQFLHLCGLVVNLIVRSWSATGPLVGVAMGSWFTSLWQRRLFVLDNKKVEYRELIGTLTNAVHELVQNGGLTGDDRRRGTEAIMAGYRVIVDRVFIEKSVREAGIEDKWKLLLAQKSDNYLPQWRELYASLIKIAHTDLGIKD